MRDKSIVLSENVQHQLEHFEVSVCDRYLQVSQHHVRIRCALIVLSREEEVRRTCVRMRMVGLR